MAQSHKFRKGESLFSTTLSSSIGTGTGDTITLGSVSGLPTDTEITLTIDRVDTNGTETPSSLERITGTISGNNLTSYTRGIDGTTEQSHDAGAVIEYIWNADDLNDIVDGILVGHTQAGLHDFNGGEVTLDADGDTTMTADTDDQIDFEVGGSDAFRMKAADFDLAGTTPNVTVDGSDPYRTINLSAPAWKEATTNGCDSVETVEAGTNDIDYQVLPFDNTSDETAFVNFQMPDSYDGGAVKFRFVWTTDSGGASETVTFELSGRAYADDDAIDQAVGTAVEVSDTWIADGDVHISTWSGDVTLAGTPAGGQLVHLEITRDVSEDDLGGDARLIAVQIKYQQAQFGD